MFTPGFDSLSYHNEKVEKLLQEAKQYRLYREAQKAESHRKNLVFDSIGKVGRRLVLIGTYLEKKSRASLQSETQLTYNMSSSNCE
jgi:hypothetical protein